MASTATESLWKSLHLTLTGPVAHMCLDRPGKSNALNLDAFEEIPQAISWIEARSEVRVIVLSGNGRNFCAGIDLGVAFGLTNTVTQAACPSRAREKLRLQILHMQQAFTAFETCRIPVIAAVQGHCVGAGIDLATACDIRCCTADAQFCVKEIDLGITADLGTLQRLFRLVGEGRARELALTAQVFSGDQALQWGLVTHTFSDITALEMGVMTLAETIAAKSPVGTSGTKQICLHARDHTVREGLEHVALWNSAQLVSSDMLEVLSALKNHRPPQFASKL